MRYRDRTDAGRQLAAALRETGFGGLEAPALVLGVARGGVAVAAPVAEAFGAPLGVVVARKLRAPHNPELAIGAVGTSGDAYVDHWLARRLRIGSEYIENEIRVQRAEIRSRLDRYGRSSPSPLGCDVAVVDDGVATGATLIAALRSVRAEAPARLMCAVPVGPPDTLGRLEAEADLVVCPLRPTGFAAVGEWYMDFTQTSDEEVAALLE